MIVEILSWACLTIGGVLGIIGAVGIHRFPDFYTRLHAVGIADTLSAMLILLGLGIQAGLTLAAFKLFLIFIFLFITSPTASHAVANAALHSGLKPKLKYEQSNDENKK